LQVSGAELYQKDQRPEAAVQDVLWSDVVLQVKKIVAGPVFGGVRACRLLFDDGEGVLRQLLDARRDGR